MGEARMNYPLEVQWALEHFQADEVQCIRDLAWSKVFVLSNKEQQAFLKVVPDKQRTALRASTLVAQQFPEHIPQIIAYNDELAAQLTMDHQGRTIQGSYAEKEQLLNLYAQIQSKAAKQPEFLAQLPSIDPATLMNQFAEFINPNGYLRHSHQLDLVSFLGKEVTQNYYTLFQNRLHQLNHFIQQVQGLPTTLNHGDLRCGNVAKTASGKLVIFDWDEVTTGVAGLSLHSLFDGCSTIYKLLHFPLQEEQAEQKQLLDVYLHTLQKSAYTSHKELKQVIAAAACLGVVQYIVSFSHYPTISEQQRQAITFNIQYALEDLLRLTDCLSLKTKQHPQQFWQDYVQTQFYGGIDHIAQWHTHLYGFDEQVTTTQLQAWLSCQRNQEACALLDRVLPLQDKNPTWWHWRARLYTQSLELETALQCFDKAEALQHSEALTHDRAFTQYLYDIEQYAQVENHVPTIRAFAQWTTPESIPPEIVSLAAKLFRQYGTLAIKQAYPTQALQAAYQSYQANYPTALEDCQNSDALCVGDKRYMQSIQLADGFNQPAIYAAPIVKAIMDQVLTNRCILGSMTAVTAFSGAQEQQLHKDHPWLFEEFGAQQYSASYAVTCLVPLTPLTPEMGGTRVFKQTQQMSLEQSEHMPSQVTGLDYGDCLLFDYHLSHQGLANTSEQARPVLSLVYQRPWFRDYVNFRGQQALTLSSEEARKIPDSLESLFAWK